MRSPDSFLTSTSCGSCEKRSQSDDMKKLLPPVPYPILRPVVDVALIALELTLNARPSCASRGAALSTAVNTVAVTLAGCAPPQPPLQVKAHRGPYLMLKW